MQLCLWNTADLKRLCWRVCAFISLTWSQFCVPAVQNPSFSSENCPYPLGDRGLAQSSSRSGPGAVSARPQPASLRTGPLWGLQPQAELLPIGAGAGLCPPSARPVSAVTAAPWASGACAVPALAARGGRDDGGSGRLRSSAALGGGGRGARVPPRGAGGGACGLCRRERRGGKGRQQEAGGPGVLACSPVFVYFLMERLRVEGSLKVI